MMPTPTLFPRMPSTAGSAPGPSGHLPLEEAQAQVTSTLTMLLKAAVAPAGRATGPAVYTQPWNTSRAGLGKADTDWPELKRACARAGEDGPGRAWETSEVSRTPQS